MKRYGGIDLHSNNSVIAMVVQDRNTLINKRLANNITAILSFLSPYKDRLSGLVVESTFNGYWLVDALSDEGYKMHLANPAVIQQYSGLKHADAYIPA